MPWFRVDDGLSDHPKVLEAGNAAMGLWVLSGSWCMKHLTDGDIPKAVVRRLGTGHQAKKLVEAGLWRDLGDHYRFHEWQAGNRQPARDDILKKRAAAAERKRKHRSRIAEQARSASGAFAKETPSESAAVDAKSVCAGSGDLSRRDSHAVTLDAEPATQPNPTQPNPYLPMVPNAVSNSSINCAVLGEIDQTPKRIKYPPAFEEFWAVYPRRVGKRKGYATWRNACQRASIDEILSGAERFADDPNRAEPFTPHPTTWLNRDGWADDALPPRDGKNSTTSRVQGWVELAHQFAEPNRLQIAGV